MAVAVERDIASATVSLRAFRQQVDDQLVTLFGVDTAGRAGRALGHYFVGNAGDVDATGCSAGVRTALASRVHGSVEYSLTQRAGRRSADDPAYLLLLAPSAVVRSASGSTTSSTSIETEVPETSTRVVVLYRVSNALRARRPRRRRRRRRPLDSRFDVQVRQSLPFMDFSSARWEMLVAVRNFFRETAADQSIYDELLVVRPPKRIVGGVTLHF